jgi:hypothetical protein
MFESTTGRKIVMIHSYVLSWLSDQGKGPEVDGNVLVLENTFADRRASG